jgi:Zn-dependent peptidase ImmA (M78 family)
MSQAFRLKMAKQKAEAFLIEEGITSLPVDPFAIATNRNIIVEAKPDTTDGVSGMLLRHGDVFGILYATHVPSEGFQRFSVAHELGHYFLDGHIDHVLPQDGIHASHAGFVSADPYELEADYFAAGLLMPRGLFKRAIKQHDPGLLVIEAMASDCRTSLTATAIRYTELTDDAVGIVISTGQTIDYCFLSEAMKSLPQLNWLRKGTAVPKGTETARLNADSDRILRADRAENEIDVMDWLGGTRSVMVTEEVVGLGRYGKTLTVLSSPTIGQEDNGDSDDDEAGLIESWIPRFRR